MKKPTKPNVPPSPELLKAMEETQARLTQTKIDRDRRIAERILARENARYHRELCEAAVVTAAKAWGSGATAADLLEALRNLEVAEQVERDVIKRTAEEAEKETPAP